MSQVTSKATQPKTGTDGQISRIERRKLEFRNRITQAAMKLFSKQGVADTSVASIIKEADIAHKTFFNHFPTKDHLLQHIVSSHSSHAYSFFQDGLKRYDDPRKRLEYCLMEIARALEPIDSQKYRELVTFYFASSASTRDFREQQKENFTNLVKQILDEGKKQKLLRDGFTVDALTEVVVGLCVSTFLNWSVDENFPIVSKMKQMVKFINASVFKDN